MIRKFYILLLTFVVCLVSTLPVAAFEQATPPPFNPNSVLSSDVFYGLPPAFSSVQKIQQFLESKGSVLANYEVEISFEPGDDILEYGVYNLESRDPQLNPVEASKPYRGRTVLVSELVWLLSRTGLANGCSGKFTNICYNNIDKPINPGFILTILQKEAGLVEGVCAQPNADSNQGCFHTQNGRYLQHRIERATGYKCFEVSSPEDYVKSCYDVNPSWKFFKGLFRQLYYMTRFIRLHEQNCELGHPYSFKDYKVGQTRYFDGQPVVFEDALTCALYIYTPHIYPDKSNIYKIFVRIDAWFDSAKIKQINRAKIQPSVG